MDRFGKEMLNNGQKVLGCTTGMGGRAYSNCSGSGVVFLVSLVAAWGIHKLPYIKRIIWA